MKKNTTINLLQSPQEKNSRRWIVGVFTLTLFFSLFSGGSWGQMNNSNALNKDAKTISSTQPIIRKASKVSESLNQSQSKKELWKNEPFGQYKSENEINDRRSENEKHFQREDGKVDMFVSSEPINYLENGLWQTIYNTISEDLTSPYKYSNTSNLFKSYYPEQIQQGFKTILEGKTVLEMQNASMYYENNGERLGEVSISNSIAKVDNNIISYPSVYGNGIDLLITQKGGKRKLDYIIQNKAALNTQFMNAEYLVFSEDIILPNGWSAKLENGAVLLMDESGKVVSLYETPSIFDSNNDNVEKLNKANNTIDFENFSSKREDKKSNNVLEDESIKYEMELNGAILTIITKVKMSFLLDIKHVYPILIDPTLTATIATITAGYFYDYQAPYGPASIATSGAPAGSAITNVNLALNVTRSQYYYFGWNTYTGNCANYHIFSLDDGDYAPLVFTCGGDMNDWNCLDPNRSWRTEIWSWDGDDYRARWGFTVTVTYETITAPTSITGTTSVCPGGSTTLTASGGTANAGSTAITTQWFTGSCGGTLVGTGASILVSPAVTTTYYARRIGQCTTTGCASVQVIVNTNNPGAVSVPTSICAGTSTSISNVTAATGAAGSVNYYFYYRGGPSNVAWQMYNGPTTNSSSSLPAAVINTPGTWFIARNSDFGCGQANNATTVDIPIIVNEASTAPILSGPSSTICPNSTVTLTASGGTAGAGSQIEWWTGPNGTGTNLGTGSSANVSPSTSTTYYVRRSGTCNTTVDATINVNVKSFIYAANNTSSAGYCTDNAGWNHFFNGDNIIFSVQGNLAAAPVGFPIASIFDNGTYFSESQFPSGGAGCASNQNPGEQRFEMERAWDLNFGGGTPSGTYSVRFYHETVERQAVETAAANYMAAYPSCGYSYLYGAAQFATNGFYWFKNTGSVYSAPDYDGLHLQSLTGTTANGINYAQMSGVTSFSGGSGAIILAPISALPVELISFTANCNETGDKVNVNWSTASEHNASYYVVDKSRDGVNWTILNTLAAAGNSTTVIEYALTDNNVVSGTTYYRLTQFDNDGISETFNIASVNCGAKQAITSNLVAYPNPSDGSFYVDFYTQDITGPSMISVFDSRGMVIYRQEVLVEKGSNVFHIEDLDAAPGMYYIKVSNGTTTSYIVKHSLR